MSFTSTKCVLIALALAGGAVCAQATAAPPSLSSDSALRARYALPASRFAVIEGETVHYVDEGAKDRPAILLVHGSFASLLQWNAWAAQLSRHYRVIRYDLSPAGLSGPSPGNDYSIARRIRVIDGLMDKLGIARFVIVGTSSGGLPAAAYAAKRPQRVRGVVLNNIAAGPFKIDYAALPQALKDAVAADAKHPDHHSPEFWRQILLNNVVDSAKVTPELVAQWTAFNDRTLGDPAIGKAVTATSSFDRTPDDLRAITAPALVLWSGDDHETTLAIHGQRTLELLGSKDKTLKVVDHCGHMAPLDCPAASLSPVEAFLKTLARK
ncbi:alpha beta hydrolase fold family [Novosphingobium sp. Rr 2-17]|uniref:alpha/beta fold hydrolase n=1 Tax=Novosphingobium sp. Rr 2-17 TaxID=555793 RepID=UPI0002698827|nr:alpha/beta hydrolase [Novosphingobium sp. Rr 2-17]EIZ80529.1 alpha beta hydrolase fold family [Novosphingobium sp. Rr 2-17]